jgi:hypothetical protein
MVSALHLLSRYLGIRDFSPYLEMLPVVKDIPAWNCQQIPVVIMVFEMLAEEK